jgi:hypothetical protein
MAVMIDDDPRSSNMVRSDWRRTRGDRQGAFRNVWLKKLN